jgi:hypothetical protein
LLWNTGSIPLFRDTFDRLFQRPLTGIVQALLRLTHPNPETRLCQEFELPGEGAAVREITESMYQFTRREYTGSIAALTGVYSIRLP